MEMNLSTAAKQAGTNAREARTVHQRPGLIQEMDWPRAPMSDIADPVSSGALCFFNGGLFRIVITYDRFKIEDIIETISATYGVATRPATYGVATRPNEEVAY